VDSTATPLPCPGPTLAAPPTLFWPRTPPAPLSRAQNPSPKRTRAPCWQRHDGALPRVARHQPRLAPIASAPSAADATRRTSPRAQLVTPALTPIGQRHRPRHYPRPSPPINPPNATVSPSSSPLARR
jgi:hypothetical protein